MKVWILKACFISLLLLCSYTARSDTASQPIDILVNSSVNVDSLSSAQLRMIFAGRTQFWPDGSRIRVFVLPADSVLHQQFCRDLLNIYPYQLERIWQRVVYSGQGEAPTEMQSAQALQEKIATTPGAIGYLPQMSPLTDTISVITVGEQR